MSVTEKVSLVPTVVDDSEPLAEISKRAFDTDIDVGAPSTGGPQGYDAPDFQARAMNWGDYHKILLEDELVGGLILSAGNEGHKIVERIFVDPNHHRKGIATRAFELMYEEYPNMKLWTLGSPEWNVRTKAFYEKLAFIQVGWDDSDPNWRGRWYERVMTPEDPYVMTPIEQLKDGMKNVDVKGKVLEKGHARLVRSRRRYGETLSVANAAIGDDSGRVVLVLWNEQIKKVQVGDRVRVENGYVSSYRGVTQLNSGLAGKLIFPI